MNLNVEIFEPTRDVIWEYPNLVKEAKEAGILFSKDTLVWVLLDNEEIVGCCGMYIRGSWAVFKCLYIKPQYRGLGYATMSIYFRKMYTAKYHPDVKQIWAHVTPEALNLHMNAGGEVKRRYKNGITKITHPLRPGTFA